MPSYPLSNHIFSKYRQFFEFNRKDYHFNVDIETGKLFLSRKLVTFRGTHLPLDLYLKYCQDFYDSSSGLNAYTGLPRGFKFNYHVYISQVGGQYNYVDKDGFVHIFALAINTSSAQPIYYDTTGSGLMMEVNSIGFDIYDENENRQLFDADGRLITVRKKISSNYQRDINITYDSLLKIHSISDQYGHTIDFDYTNPSQILIKRNTQILFAINVSNNNLLSIQRYTSSIDYFSDSFDWVNDGLEELELASGEIFNIAYSSSKVSAFSANYKQNYYSLTYDTSNKRTCVQNARGIVTLYDYDQNSLSSRSSNNNVDLGYLSLSKDASFYIIKDNIPNNQKLDFNLQPYGQTPVYNNQTYSANSTCITASVSSSVLYAKRNYVLHTNIVGDLGNDSFVVEMYNSSNVLLAKQIFKGKAKNIATPVGLPGSGAISDSFYLKLCNNSNNQITVILAHITPLLGDFSMLATNIDCANGVFSYDNNNYYYLTSGVSFSFKNGSTSISTPTNLYMTESDYLANERLFYKRTENSFKFWCNDKTILIDNLTEASIGLGGAINAIYYNVDNKPIIYRHKSLPSHPLIPVYFYKISGSEDNSFIVNEFSHIPYSISPNPPLNSFRQEKETRHICGNQTIVCRFYDKYNRLLSNRRSDGITIDNVFDNKGNLTNESTSSSNDTKIISSSYSYDLNDNLDVKETFVNNLSQETYYSYDSDNNLYYVESPGLDIFYSYESILKEKVASVSFYHYPYYCTQIAGYYKDELNSVGISDSFYQITHDKGEISNISNNNETIISYSYYPQIYDGQTLYDTYYTYFPNNYAYIREYDGMGRLVSNEYLFYTYDSFSNVSSIQDTTINVQESHIYFNYDYRDRLIGIYNENTHIYLENIYDDFGRIDYQTFEEYSEGLITVSYNYYSIPGLEKNEKKSTIYHHYDVLCIEDEVDSFSRLNNRTAATGVGDCGILTQFSYCHNSNRTNFLVEEITYLEIANGAFDTSVFKKDTYSYNGSGNIISITRSQSDSQVTNTITYEYDLSCRLIRENNPYFGESYIYSYDAKGNIISKQIFTYSTGVLSNPLSTKTYYYDSYCPDRLISYGTELFTYDNHGNPTMYRDAYLWWYRGNLLHSYTKGLMGVQLNYDGFRNIANKIVSHGNALVYEITYDYINGQLLRENRPNNCSLLFLYAHSGIAGFDYQGSLYFYEKNMQQDVIAIRDSDNQVVAKYIYDAWGNHLVLTPNDMVDTNLNSVGNINPFRYRSCYYDTDLKMYWLASRFYDSEIGRFISPDSWEYLDFKKMHGLNLYAYCKNNPVMYYDPSGHFIITLIGTLIAIGAAALAMSIGGYIEIRKLHAEHIASTSDKTKKPKEYNSPGVIEYDADGLLVWIKICEDEDDPDKTTLTVYDSWKYNKEEIRKFLTSLKNNPDFKCSNLNVEKMLNEWMWHNFGYTSPLSFIRGPSKDADMYLNSDDTGHFIYSWIINNIKYD